jgi:hypothetical protein
MAAKPIFIIRFPKNIPPREFMEMSTKISQTKEFNDDYHILTIVDYESRNNVFEVHNAPHEETDFNELKERVLKVIQEKL